MSLTQTEPTHATQPKGGAFLLEDATPDQIFTPENFTEEQRMVQTTAEEFVAREVFPHYQQILKQDWPLTRSMLKKAGEIGLAGLDVPEQYGGMALDIPSSMLVVQSMSAVPSFAASFGAHTGIGTLPIVFFGTEAQKRKYLPRIASGEWASAYALTESGSGSDALAAKTTARLSPDGKHYVLNGTKAWITNAGFADLFIVFAKVDGDKFTGFIVERSFTGVSTGAEEHKMGLRGSSTRVLNLDNVPVPVENVLGEIGKGHKIAFNVLNFGRFKLGVGCVGGCKLSTTAAVQYANQRQQFGAPIASFGAIKHKLGQMATLTWIGESMVFRTAGLIEAAHQTVDRNDTESVLKAVEEYVIECSIIKVLGTEFLDYVVDECVQVHGGNGYSSEYQAEHAYRDSRINRIFEGTNEINRLLIPAMLIKRAMKGTLPLVPAAMKVMEEVLSPSPMAMDEEGLLTEERRLITNAKKLTLLSAGAAFQKYMEALKDEQEILMSIADLIMEVYAMESGYLRALKIAGQRGEEAAKIYLDMVRLYAHEGMQRCTVSARRVVSACAEGDVLRTTLAALNRFSKLNALDTIRVRRGIAEQVIAAGAYKL